MGGTRRQEHERHLMQIQLKGRNVPVTDELREHVDKRFRKVGKQVSELARLEIEIAHERNPSIAKAEIAEVTLYLKGVTLRAHDADRDLKHAINMCEEELSRQVKRHRDKRRKRRESRAASGRGFSPAT
jgi:putative sigma-54 modulation protein